MKSKSNGWRLAVVASLCLEVAGGAEPVPASRSARESISFVEVRLTGGAGDSANLYIGAQPLASLAVLRESAHFTTTGGIRVAYREDKAGMWDPLESTCRHASLSIL